MDRVSEPQLKWVKINVTLSRSVRIDIQILMSHILEPISCYISFVESDLLNAVWEIYLAKLGRPSTDMIK